MRVLFNFLQQSTTDRATDGRGLLRTPITPEGAFPHFVNFGEIRELPNAGGAAVNMSGSELTFDFFISSTPSVSDTIASPAWASQMTEHRRFTRATCVYYDGPINTEGLVNAQFYAAVPAEVGELVAGSWVDICMGRVASVSLANSGDRSEVALTGVAYSNKAAVELLEFSAQIPIIDQATVQDINIARILSSNRPVVIQLNKNEMYAVPQLVTGDQLPVSFMALVEWGEFAHIGRDGNGAVFSVTIKITEVL